MESSLRCYKGRSAFSAISFTAQSLLNQDAASIDVLFIIIVIVIAMFMSLAFFNIVNFWNLVYASARTAASEARGTRAKIDNRAINKGASLSHDACQFYYGIGRIERSTQETRFL